MKEHLEEWVVAETIGEVWEKWQVEEDERIRKEEDERSWAEARAFRTYSLSVTYFYRWLKIFRKRRVKKRIQMEREKARAWNSPQSVAARKAEEEAAKQKRHEESLKLVRERKALNKSRREKEFRESIQSQEEDVEKALLASGVFKGMRDEQAAAREAAADDDEPLTMLPSEMLRRTENRRREKHGLRPISRNSTTSSNAKLGSKTAKLLALANGRDTLSNPASSVRNSTYSSSFRSSVGFNTSRVEKTKKSRVKDPYWQYKVHGLVLMPDGKYAYQPEALEKFRKTTMRESEPSDSLASTPIEDTPRHSLFAVANDLDGTHNSSPSPAISRVSSMKRKRPATVLPDETEEDEDLTAYRSEASAPSRKRAKSDDDSDADFLAQMSGLLQEVEDERKKLE